MRFGEDELGGDYRDMNVKNVDEGNVCICFG
jgi:hypothetical protein